MITLFGYLTVLYVIPVIISLFVFRYANKLEENKRERLSARDALIPLWNILLILIAIAFLIYTWLTTNKNIQNAFDSVNTFINYK